MRLLPVSRCVQACFTADYRKYQQLTKMLLDKAEGDGRRLRDEVATLKAEVAAAPTNLIRTEGASLLLPARLRAGVLAQRIPRA